MKISDQPQFAATLSGVYAMYKNDLSDALISIWWETCKSFDFSAVSEAFTRHCMNPDNGQYLPKPADIIRLLGGTSQDGGLIAWAKVDRALRSVGTYQTVVFDDPIIHAVIMDMGGWVSLGTKSEDEWPFVGKEFQNRYRGYRLQGGVREYVKSLVGLAEAQNSQNGMRSQPPVLIGDTPKAMQVLANGAEKIAIGWQQMNAEEYLQLAAPVREVA